MPSIKDIRDRIARLAARRDAKAAKIATVEPAARAAVVDGKTLNGKLADLHALTFERDALDDEVRRLRDVELPAAERAQAEADRRRALALARKIHENRVAAAARLDAALASAEQSLAALVGMQDGYARAMEAAGARQAAPHWDLLLRRAAWASAPDVADRLGATRQLRTSASPMAELLRRHEPPREPDPLEMPAEAPVAENKLRPPRGDARPEPAPRPSADVDPGAEARRADKADKMAARARAARAALDEAMPASAPGGQ